MRINKNIFLEKKINNDLIDNGYSIVDVLSSNDIKYLLELYKETRTKDNNINNHLYVSSRECDFNTSIQISNKIRELIQPYFQTIAIDFDLYGGAFLSKPKLIENEFSLHQDFTLVEKEKDKMYAIWIALQDTTINNGCMYIVKNSHKLFDNYVSASYNNHKIHRNKISNKYIIDIELKAGQGMIFCDNIFHGSYPNVSSEDRIAITTRIANKGAQFVFYDIADKNTCIQYNIEPHDLIQYFDDFQKGNLPKHLTESRRFHYIHRPITSKYLQIALKYNSKNGKNSTLQKLYYNAQLYCDKILNSI
ncbi:MAG: phytanoyl-CoA dioxygenase family protein [Sphingobacteriales bacterium]|jgi:hypothetical protein|nr:MAG: phytanoyl-CoA dioxygenase family protein [Sphingobacteriales bacterium]